MGVEYLRFKDNNTVIDLSKYCGSNITSLIITKEILSISLTSHNISCNLSIIIEPREKELNINISDLNIETTKEISINFAGGKCNCYKNKFSFSGINQIVSHNNIAMCITNNQTVEITGKKGGLLKLRGGSTAPTIGNNEFTSGSGHLILKGAGDIDITGGLGESNNTRVLSSAEVGSNAISFYNESDGNLSSVDILDNINVTIKGEKGQDLTSISMNNCTGKGGSGIYIRGRGRIMKTGKGSLIIKGGNGGNCIGSMSSGRCSDGGEAIKIGFGRIVINSPSTINSGDGGNAVFNKNNYVIAKGGNGGDVIRISPISPYSLNRISYIRISSGVDINTGCGGTSGIDMNTSGIQCYQGGNGGNIITSDTPTEVSMGTVSINIGEGGLGGTFARQSGIKGLNGVKFKGPSIKVINTPESKTFETDSQNDNICIKNQPLNNKIDINTSIPINPNPAKRINISSDLDSKSLNSKKIGPQLKSSTISLSNTIPIKINNPNNKSTKINITINNNSSKTDKDAVIKKIFYLD